MHISSEKPSVMLYIPEYFGRSVTTVTVCCHLVEVFWKPGVWWLLLLFGWFFWLCFLFHCFFFFLFSVSSLYFDGENLWLGSFFPGTCEEDGLALSQSEHKDRSSSAQLGAGVGSQSLQIALGHVLAGRSVDLMTPRQGGRVLQPLCCVTLEKPWADLVSSAKKWFIKSAFVSQLLAIPIWKSCNWNEAALVCILNTSVWEKKWGEGEEMLEEIIREKLIKCIALYFLWAHFGKKRVLNTFHYCPLLSCSPLFHFKDASVLWEKIVKYFFSALR